METQNYAIPSYEVLKEYYKDNPDYEPEEAYDFFITPDIEKSMTKDDSDQFLQFCIDVYNEVQ